MSAPETMALPPSGEQAPPARPPRRWLRRTGLIVVIVIGLAGLGGGGFSLYRELTRPATPAEVSRALQKEIASRWERLPAGKIFPGSISYMTSEGANTKAHLVGIAPPASCAAALDSTVAQAFAHRGCIKVLRATYLDAAGTTVLTTGVAVLPSGSAAARAAADLSSNDHAGVRAVAFPGTLTYLFRDSGREWFNMTAQGPYVFLSAVGFTTGARGRDSGTDSAFAGISTGVTGHEIAVLTSGKKPCQREDIRC